jgi:hypothetical protein
MGIAVEVGTVPASTVEVGSAGVGPDSEEAPHPAIRTAIAAITVRSADERIAPVLVMVFSSFLLDSQNLWLVRQES